jgi:methylenetetrahydrofolate dehydrogenase (NADP+)/methenyltetrahydrofolate cyclohydrolase
MAVILDGRPVAAKILSEVGREISTIGVTPRLAIVSVGNNPASEVYIKNKMIRAKEVGVDVRLIGMAADTPAETVLAKILELNADTAIHGIIVQAPLPNKAMENAVFNAIDPAKDVDGFGEANVGRLAMGIGGGFVPCTPLGIYELLRAYGIGVRNRHVVIVGRSNIVGRPLSLLLSQKNPEFDATVTLCHSATENLAALTRMADIVVVAVGKKSFLKGSMVSTGAVVVDVGITREPANAATGHRLCGDVDFESLGGVCHALTPVPGGVGPMTVAMLLRNVAMAAKLTMGADGRP